MAEPADLLGPVRASMRELSALAGALVSAPPEVAEQIAVPLQRQAELLEQILQRQLEFERDFVGRVLAPAGTLFDVIEQTTVAMQAQTTAYRAAATSFIEIADLIEKQVELLRLASQSVRDPVAAMRAAGDELRANLASGSGAAGG